MAIKALNAYRIIHKNGELEEINADSIITALNNMVITEEESTVLNVFLVKEGIRTVTAEPEPDPGEEEEPTPDNNEGETEVGGELDLGENH